MALPYIIIIILLILLIIILILIWRSFRTKAPTMGINNVTVNITPMQLPAGSKKKFKVTVYTTGYSDSSTSRNFKIELLEWDPIDNDLLDEYSSTSLGTSGIAPKQIGNTPVYVWEVIHHFELWCDGTTVTGAKGSSGESDPDIFARFKVMHGTPTPEHDSQTVKIRCVSGE